MSVPTPAPTNDDHLLDTPEINNYNHLLIIPVCSATAGMTIGFIRSSRMASLRFLAENAHRPPTTLQGWYFYNKTKNYRVLLAGFKGAGREALRLGAMGCSWVALEEGCQSLGSTIHASWLASGKEIIAGTGTAAIVAAIYRLPRRTVFRTVGLGFCMGATVSALRLVQSRLGKDQEEKPAVAG
ncbi:hypothetical protein FRB95_008772 [Tulasnella sp. JGI-2019a]|nr:hypothetical protein FRB95_008772 [Tulasnella sp. JGI-2019a]